MDTMSERGESPQAEPTLPAGDRTARDAQRAPESGPPLQQQGDALLDGSGTRHGVDARDERPRTEEPPPV
jgi:hypothetical protein